MHEEELLEIVDREGAVLGIAPRSKIHGDPALLHRVVHVMVVSDGGEILLQKRSMRKDVAPGRWDTSVGGHVDPGESLTDAALREMAEELGSGGELEFLYSYIHANPYESELVTTYRCVKNGGFTFNRDEIDEVRFFGIEEIISLMGTGTLSDNFEHEVRTYLDHIGRE